MVAAWGDERGSPRPIGKDWSSPAPSSSERRGMRRPARTFAATGRCWAAVCLLFLGAAGVLASEDQTCKSSDGLTCREDTEESGSRGGHISRALLATDCNCNGHGACAAAGSNYLCDCDFGWNPSTNCSMPTDCSALAGCSGHGICVKGPECRCDPPWSGAVCNVSACPRSCSGHGTCQNGVCLCDIGWREDLVSCSLRSCASNCTNGVCVDGECECNPGYTGPGCDDFECENQCSGHGTCEIGLGKCVCYPWYTGADCSTALCPSNCSGNGICSGGVCVCDNRHAGHDCSIPKCPHDCSGRGLCLADSTCSCQTGYYGSGCEIMGNCPIANCSGHGTCADSTCICDLGWGGAGCEEQVMVNEGACLSNCSMHGTCMNGTCICDAGWMGDDCAMTPGCANDCSGHGACANGTCVCDVGWTAHDCSLHDGAAFCAQNCSTGFGVYLNGTCDCSMPTSGHETMCPNNCTGRGSCQNGVCSCDVGYGGTDCSMPVLMGGMLDMPSCLNNCSDHGSCVNGTCLCDIGWVAMDCSERVLTIDCPTNCSAQGSCVNGTCLCDAGFLGPACNLVAEPSELCQSNCSGHGSCVNSTCWCDQGYFGATCSDVMVMNSSLFDIGSTPVPSAANKICPAGCSGHGVCVDGACVCDPLYAGEACDRFGLILIASCPNHCSNRGTCVNGTCLCDRPYQGADCGTVSVCPGHVGMAGNCSGRGDCVNGTCACDNGWSGLDCSISTCRMDCSGHGMCSNGTCACDYGWRGSICADISCPNDCSNHGVCSADPVHPTCVCDASWAGADCSIRLCPTIDPTMSCSGHGACAQNGTCICNQDYIGDDCSILQECRGRGVKRCGFCICEEGFAGDECEVDLCRDSRIYHPEFPTDWTQSTVCAQRGVCTTGSGCVCDAGWAGKNCSVPAVCTGKPPGSTDPPPPEGWAVGCGARGVCSGSRDSAGSCSCENFTIPFSPFPTPRFTNGTVLDDTGKFIGWKPCAVPECPGLSINPVTGARTECSGTGACNRGNPNSPFCSCFTVTNEGLYSGIDCGIPPLYRISEISPKVGPLEGGATITVRGPAIERLAARYADGLFCDFQSTVNPPAMLGSVRDSLVCVAPPQPSARTVVVTLRDIDGLMVLGVPSSAAFEYFEQTTITRMTPTFGPLRPIPPAKNSITVTGSYFPRNGQYQCKFGDCVSPSARREDQVTLVCEMPTVAKGEPLPITVSSDSQTFSEEGGREALFTAYEVTAISPRCASEEGVAIATVFGRNLVDEQDTTRNPNEYVCSFGRGSTRFFSLAVVSETETNALECATPSNSLEQEDDFALSLDAQETFPGAAVYDGRWDQTPLVNFNTYSQASIERGPDTQFLIAPTVGPTLGGTFVTISGFGFQYSVYGRNNPYFASWEPMMPGCNPRGIPTCTFGTDVTNEMTIISPNLVVCKTPTLVNTGKTVRMEIALDGQSYTASGSRFQFVEPWAVTGVSPSSGVASGGTLLTVQGYGFVDSVSGGDGEFPEVLSCVFVSDIDSSVKTIVKATFNGPTEVTCITEDMGGSSFTTVHVSLSGQLDDSQLGDSDAAFRFYLDPVIEQIVHPVGSIMRTEEVKIDGENFEEMGTPVLCRFGDDGEMIVEGRYADTKTVFCQPPIVSEPMTVNVSLSFNGFDWTNVKLYTFYDLVRMEPSSGPLSGGTVVSFKIDGGRQFNHSEFVLDYTVRFGDGTANSPCQGNCIGGRYDKARDLIIFETVNQTRAASQSEGKRRAVFLQLTTNGPFEQFGVDFIFYDASYSSISPCLGGSCKEVALPNDGRPYTVSLRGFGLFDMGTAMCAFLPIQTGQADGKLSFNAFEAGMVTDNDAIFSPAQYEGVEDGRGSIGCTAPALNLTTSDGYYVTVAMNGQNFVHQVFNIFYIDQPNVTALSHAGGLIDRSLTITVTATSWRFPAWYTNLPPTTLSCLFFAPETDSGVSTFMFATAEEVGCSGATCTATCDTPASFEPSHDAVLKTQVFISLNRRDPCMECRVAQGLDLDQSLISKFDGNFSNGFCSKTRPIAPDTDVMIGSCGQPGAAYQWFTFYQAPLVQSLSPSAVGPKTESIHNKSIPVTLAGEFFRAASWRDWSRSAYDELESRVAFCDADPIPKVPAKVRASFSSEGRMLGSYETIDVDYDWCTDAIEMRIILPCVNTTIAPLAADVVYSCFHTHSFLQTSRRMDVTFELSLNDGVQYTLLSKFLQVYEEETCPATGCGHGSCVESKCRCGIWDRNASDPCQNVGTLSVNLNFVSELRPLSMFTGGEDPFAWTPSDFFKTATAFLADGTASQGKASELSCNGGPLLNAASPSVGSLLGQTTVQVDLAVFAASGIVFSEADNVACYFGSCRTNATLTYVQAGDPTSGRAVVERYECQAPAVDPATRSVELYVTFENARGVQSPLPFDGRINFLYYVPPNVSNVLTLGGERDRNSLLSVPVCGGGMQLNLCDQDPYFRLAVEGAHFLDVDFLGCRAGGILTASQYVQADRILCLISRDVVPQVGVVQVTLDHQVFTAEEESPSVLFYNPPKAVKDSTHGFGVDPQFVGRPLETILGYDPGIIEPGQYSQVAPVTGGTPLVFYLSDPPQPMSGEQNFNLSFWGRQGTMRLRFGECKSSCDPSLPYSERFGTQCQHASGNMPDCTCTRGLDVPAFLNRTEGADADNNQIWKLQASTPAVGTGAAGKYMMCFAANGVHYLPMIHGDNANVASDRYYFNFYEVPQVNSLHLTAGPVKLDNSTYRIHLIGANFLQKAFDVTCDLVEIGLCPEQVPRIFVYIGGVGLTAKGVAVPVSSSQITTISPTEMSFEVPDVRQIPDRKYVANITMSYNGWDWSSVAQGQTEFTFFRFPVGPLKMTPRWSHIDFPTVITIIGRDFDLNPERTMCRFTDCDDPTRFVLVPAIYWNSTQMLCTTPPRLRKSPGSIIMETVERLCVAYTPDGTESTKIASPILYETLFQSADPSSVDPDTPGIDGILNVAEDVVDVTLSANAAPIEGGSDFTILIDNLEHREQCLDYAQIDQPRIVFLPTSPAWQTLRPRGYGETIPVLVKSFQIEDPPTFDWDAANAAWKRHCRLFIYVSLPHMPFPMTADLRFSFNGGQKFVGPSVSVLFYRLSAPLSLVPVRGSTTATRRPEGIFTFSSELLEGANPTISSSTANFLFRGDIGCNMTTLEGPIICPLGPRCRFFIPGSMDRYVEVPGTYTHDAEQPTLECTVPQSPSSGPTLLNVTLDGVNWVRNENPPNFLYYDQPCVSSVYPTNGLWEAETEITVLGSGFLASGNETTHQLWCIFDFQDLRPSVDSWNVRRTWSRAEAICETAVVCKVPPIEEEDRPLIPANPRARVGIIVDGRCADAGYTTGKCNSLLNADRELLSAGYFLYHSVPTLESVSPLGGFVAGGLQVTVTGSGYIEQLNEGHSEGWPVCANDDSGAVFRVASFQRLCAQNGTCGGPQAATPCTGLTCRFGDITTPAMLISPNEMVCTTPQFDVQGAVVTNLSVSLNGKEMEFADPLGFIFADTSVSSISPNAGAFDGGDLLRLSGSNYVASNPCSQSSSSNPDLGACLQCLFTGAPIAGTNERRTQYVAATFVSSTLITCSAPAGDLMGFSADGSDESCGEGYRGCISVQVSPNGVEFTPVVPQAVFGYLSQVTFNGYSPNAGSTIGSTNITVTGTGYTPTLQVWCIFDQQRVRAVYVSSTMLICTSPAKDSAVVGGVFFGFSVNNENFCTLVADGWPDMDATCDPALGNCVCQFLDRDDGEVLNGTFPFFYHDVMVVDDILPPSGKRTGFTPVFVVGSGFKDFGQRLSVWFGTNVSSEATIVNDTHIKCLTPPMPEVLGPTGLALYWLDTAVEIVVTSNNQSYTKEEKGDDCTETVPGELLQTFAPNPQGYCDEKFVMFSWFEMPSVTLLRGTSFSGFYSKLHPVLYDELQGTKDIPQGPVEGGTIITLIGADFTSLSRPTLQKGQISGVACNVDTTDPVCRVACDFPFGFENKFHYSCINVPRDSSQTEPEYWCSVGGSITYDGKYGTCNTTTAVWRDYEQAGKVITRLQCKFGDLPLVPANVIDNATVTCRSPPTEHGIIVPVSVTLNGKDFSEINLNTYFQYLQPSPQAIHANLSSTGDKITVVYDVPTNLQGLQNPGRVMPPEGDLSGCLDLFSEEFVATLGNTIPSCKWSADSTQVVITVGSMATFQPGDTVVFQQRACEAQGPDACSENPSPTDLLIEPLKRIGCYYPRLGECVQVQSEDPNWCGRCIPDEEVQVIELSYAFLQNTRDLEIEGPLATVKPTAVIVGPKTVDTCQTVCFCDGCAEHGDPCSPASTACPGTCRHALAVLDGRSSSGAQRRPWASIEWSLSTNGTTDPSVADNLTAINDLVAVIPRTVMAARLPLGGNLTYCFNLKVTNWFGETGMTRTCHPVTQINLPLPSVVILSPSSSLSKMSASVSLNALVEESACSVQNPVYAYQWTVAPEPDGWSDVDSGQKNLYVRAFTVTWAPARYTFTLHTTFTQGPEDGRTSRTFTSDVQVTFTATKPKAMIAKGHRYVGMHFNLDLDGSGSYDEDSAPGSAARTDLAYCWSCVRQQDGADCGWNLENVATQEVDKTLLSVGEYRVTLTVAKPSSTSCSNLEADGVLAGSTSVTINVVNGDSSPPAAFLDTPTFQFITDASPLRLTGEVFSGSCTGSSVLNPTCAVDYFWTITPPLIQDVQGRTTPSYDPQETDAEQTVTQMQSGYGSISLIVGAKQFGIATFEDSTLYTFTLTAREGDREVHSFISLLKNPGPAGGTFTVSPSRGIALDTYFTFTCDGWVDENLPLYYQFFMDVNGAPMSLGPPSLSTSLRRLLPRGDPNDNDKLVLSARVYDSLQAAIETPTATVEVELSTSFNITKFTRDMQNIVDNLYNSGDRNGAILHLGLVGHVLNEPELINAVALRNWIMPTFVAIVQRTYSRTARRLLQLGPVAADPDGLEALLPGFLQILTAVPSTLVGTSACPLAMDTLQSELANYNALTSTETDDAKVLNNAEQFLRVCFICQNSLGDVSEWGKLFEIVRYLGLLYMKNRAAGEGKVFGNVNDMGVTFWRYSNTLSQSQQVEIYPQIAVDPILVTIPSTVMSGFTSASFNQFDFHGIAFRTESNPYDSVANSTRNSRVFSGTIRAAADLSTRVVSDSAFADLKIQDLADPIVIRLETLETVDENRNEQTGVYTASVCGFWNETLEQWMQFGESRAQLATSQLACPTYHLSDFTIIQGSVGCDDKAAADPVVNNECRVCNGGDPEPLTGICDHEGVPCLEPLLLDDCFVCNGKNERFKGDRFRNETGICDFMGRVCGLIRSSDGTGEPQPSVPTVCGICDLEANMASRTKGGICDCNRMPHGTAVEDRCGVCGGGNATMDDCGVNGAIPAAFVCHSQGQNPDWNRACTGCDGQALPLMRWDPPTSDNPYGIGGLRVDMCGVCGGDGSTCTGCGGIRGAVEDVCGVCQGDGSTCLGCDEVSRAVPWQRDSCGRCVSPEESFFGACDRDPQTSTIIECNYTTFEPKELCRQDCAGELKGRVFDRCGICGGPNVENCDALNLDSNNWTAATGCRFGVFTDECGKCGGDGTSCLGCSNTEGTLGMPFSGLVPDQCGVCEGDDTSCIGCDNKINSGKVEDDCGVCDGGNAAKDICGVCFGDNTMCAGCDGIPYSGKALDACEECGGNNYCKWRDGDPPPESEGSFEAVVLEWQLAENPGAAVRPAPPLLCAAFMALLALARVLLS